MHRCIRPAMLMILPWIVFATASAQWQTQGPLPTYLDIRGIGAPTSERIFVATDDDAFDQGGALFESTDGGDNWTQRPVPGSLGSPLNGIFFFDDLLGWAYGNDNYRTTDGGTTWTALPFLGSTYAMQFYTPAFGLASGNFDRYVSSDAGDSWSASSLGRFSFADNLTGFGIGDSGIYRTTNGGGSFSLVLAGAAKAVAALSGTALVGIVDTTFVRSTDGGTSWSPAGATMGRTRLLAVPSGAVLAWGRSGDYPDLDDRLLRSTDGGATWSDLGEAIPAGVFAFAVPGAATVIAADLDGNMFRSTNAGSEWTQTYDSPGPRPGYMSSAAPAFPEPLTGYFGYGAGFVIKTTDGGASWFQISGGTGASLNDIGRFSGGGLIAVGAGGAILTSDGTSRWTLRPAVSPGGITALDAPDDGGAVIVDENGVVYRSDNGGAVWSALSAAPAGLFPATDIRFTSALEGWVTGYGYSNGALFHTTDGGNSWNPVPGFLGAYAAVEAYAANIWAAHVGGVYQRSTDAGATWTVGQLPGWPAEIRDMEFFDESTGYAVGRGGYAVRTSDGGQTWTILPTPFDSHDFTDLDLVGANELWISTNNGAAYYSATGGQNWSVMEVSPGGSASFSAIVAGPSGSAWMAGALGSIEYFAGPPPQPLNRPPDVSFGYLASGLTLSFANTSADPDGSILGVAWDFGDGTVDTGWNPSHTFPAANTYLVQLTVTDDDSATGTAARAIAVQPLPGGSFGNFTETTPLDSLFVTPEDEDFWVVATAPADFDGDGDFDIAVLGYYVVYFGSVDTRLLLLRNEGPSAQGRWQFTHSTVPAGTLTAGASDLAWGDADADGDQDLAVGSDGRTVLFRNDAGTLVPTSTVLPGYYEDNLQAEFDLRSLSWADYDNDGDPDLFIPSVFDTLTYSYRTALLRNDGADGSGGLLFTESGIAFPPTAHAQSAWADDDADGDLDLLLVNVDPASGGSFVARYRNDGQGVFTGEAVLDSTVVDHGEVQWIDYDADGDLDILAAGSLVESGGIPVTALRIYRNEGGAYVPVDVIACPSCDGWYDLTAATWADYDNDGDVDILLAGNYNSGSEIEGRAIVFINTAGVFADSGDALPAPNATGDRGGTFSWLDIDGDGDLDYFIAGEYFVPGGNGLVEAQMHLYRNDAPGNNTPPSAPSGLSVAFPDSESLVVSWDAAADDHTPAPALTYALELYRDGVPAKIAPHLPEPGNVGAVTEWTFSRLGEGFYEWALRAVDAAYAGSPLVVGAFSIGPEQTMDLGFDRSWNLLSVPVRTASGLKSDLFPAGTSGAYGYDGAYQVKDTLETGKGYWMSFDAARTVSFTGYPLANGAFDLVTGWNLVGSIGSKIACADITSEPPKLMVSEFFGYEDAYTSADTIEPGEAYWVKSSASGRLILSSPAPNGAALTAAAPNPAARITIVPGPDLPPPPPGLPETDGAQAVPVRHALNQNYPNPFNGSTRIQYELAADGQVRLEVFNVLGERVATLVDGRREAGYHVETWSSGDLPSGVYHIRMTIQTAGQPSGPVTESRKIVLSK